MDPKGNTEDAEMRDQGEAFYVVSEGFGYGEEYLARGP